LCREQIYPILFPPMKRYEQLAEKISHQIRARVLRAGDRLPSVRQASLAHRVSRGTVLRAYYALEDRGEIRTRPRSGYYVTPQREGMPPTPEMSRPAKVLSTPGVRNLVFDVLESERCAPECAGSTRMRWSSTCLRGTSS
jgi:DNA-binding transcriptional regulator YhcF (GntR family)